MIAIHSSLSSHALSTFLLIPESVSVLLHVSIQSLSSECRRRVADMSPTSPNVAKSWATLRVVATQKRPRHTQFMSITADKSPNHFKESSSIIHQTDMYSPSADEGNSASTKVGFPMDFKSGRQSAPDGDGTCFVQIPSTYEGERPSATDGYETCFVQIPSTHEGERKSAVDSRRVWPIDLVDKVRSILQLPIRQPS